MHKRDPRLHGLSHDHHHALVLARTAKRSAELPAEEHPAIWAKLQEDFASRIRAHFEVEEELMFRPLEALGEVELVVRARDEHAELEELIARGSPHLLEFGERLAAHVRFEEAEVFNRAQEVLSDDELTELAAARPAQYA